jgi:single-strand DNA-binding protein
MNHITIMGRLTRNPEMRTTPTGVEVCHFSVAVERRYKNQDGTRTTDFFECRAWKALAAFVHTYFKRGNRILVEGSIEFRKYTGKDGIERRATDLKVINAEFCESKASGQADAGQADAGESVPSAGQADSGPDDQSDDELPF